MERLKHRPGRMGRGLLGFACAGLGLATVLGIVGVWRSLWTRPPAEPCPLPQLGVPRPGDLLAWSPDGKRLLSANRMGEAWVVRFPSRAVEPLPRFSQTPWGAAWDGAGRPLLIFRTAGGSSLARLNRRGDAWERLPIAGEELAVAPDGRMAAAVGAGTTGRKPVARAWDLATLKMTHSRPLPGNTEYELSWLNQGQALLEERQPPPRRRLVYRPADASLRDAKQTENPPAPPVDVQYAALVVSGERLRAHVAGLLHVQAAPPMVADWRLWICGPGRGILQDVSVGRRSDENHRDGAYHTWKSLSVSPDGRYVAARAADDTLRLLEIGPEVYRQAARLRHEARAASAK